MATIFSTSDGTLIGLAGTYSEELQSFSPAPTGTANTLRFDEETNPFLVGAINSDWNNYRLSGSALTYKGTAVTISAAGANSQAQQLVQSAITLLRAGNATNAQIQTVLAVVLAKLRQNGIL